MRPLPLAFLENEERFAPSLPSRLPEHDVSADIGVANHRGLSLVKIDNATIGNSDSAIGFGSCIDSFNVADLKADVVGIDVLEFDRRRSLAFIHGKQSQFDAQAIVCHRLWEPAVEH